LGKRKETCLRLESYAGQEIGKRIEKRKEEIGNRKENRKEERENRK